jgi:hypothetical protein
MNEKQEVQAIYVGQQRINPENGRIIVITEVGEAAFSDADRRGII